MPFSGCTFYQPEFPDVSIKLSLLAQVLGLRFGSADDRAGGRDLGHFRALHLHIASRRRGWPVFVCSVRGSPCTMGSDGFEKVLIGTLGPRETFVGVAKRRAAKNSVLASGAKHTRD